MKSPKYLLLPPFDSSTNFPTFPSNCECHHFTKCTTHENFPHFKSKKSPSNVDNQAKKKYVHKTTKNRSLKVTLINHSW